MVDEKYYRVAPPQSVGERVAIMARDRIYDDMMRICRLTPADTILDVGVSDVVTDAANMLERKYPHPDRITAAGLGRGDAFSAAYPQIAYRQIEANRSLPFPDRAFDIAVSTAVLEHVGSVPHQIAFVRELLRVGKRAFISVPNRHFPIEHQQSMIEAFPQSCRGSVGTIDTPSDAAESALEASATGICRAEHRTRR